ncbi:site-specific integrase [Roseivirga pacifica]|uniref:site-specific integrase n=1 Tax=Roseivirga pacifica TaxID=1267423 RepID=UPI0013C2ABF8|nr:site-specific integrase [Roseivirga pacifica]
MKKLKQQGCSIPLLKEAFLFSCFTGLRWSDIQNLKWSDIKYLKEGNPELKLRIKKTNRFQVIPLASGAISLLMSIPQKSSRVFHSLSYSHVVNNLQNWISEANIDKKITFHCARHTNATWQITTGTDLYTVKSNLGHKHIKTTELYSKVIDDKKKKAIEKLEL